MAPQLHHSLGKAEANDYVEGVDTHTFSAVKSLTRLQTRLAASRNANDESEVDDSMLNAGLFTYPVLQAADILLYKCARLWLILSVTLMHPGLRTFLLVRTKSNISSLLVT